MIMSRVLVRNGYFVTVDGAHSIFPGGFVAVDGSRISAVGSSAQMPRTEEFDEIIDAAGTIILPGLINMHQHHWYTLFKGLADGFLLEDWVTDFLLPLSLKLDALRVSSSQKCLKRTCTATNDSDVSVARSVLCRRPAC
jgi:5-methylthioadenosine/S-adenosylhomocysteine deaminase